MITHKFVEMGRMRIITEKNFENHDKLFCNLVHNLIYVLVAWLTVKSKQPIYELWSVK